MCAALEFRESSGAFTMQRTLSELASVGCAGRLAFGWSRELSESFWRTFGELFSDVD